MRNFAIAGLLAIFSVALPSPLQANESCQDGSCPGESVPLVVDTCRADVTNDGDVDTADLTQILATWADPESGCWALAKVLGNWGTCPTMPADVDGDGDVDRADILALINARDIDCRVDLDRNKVLDERDLETWDCLFELGDLGTADLGTADLNCDGLLDYEDMLLVQVAIDEQRDCRFDLNGDGEIGWSDLVIVADDKKPR